MKSKKNINSKVSKILGIPDEVTTPVPRIVSLGFRKVWIENYKSILEYQDVSVRIRTSMGIININGFELKMEEMTTDDILIEGIIDSIEFEEIEE